MTAPEGRKPVLIVVAGANGSGKTTLTNQLLTDRWLRGVTYLNPDAIAEERFGGWNDPKAVLQAAQYVTEQREAALAKGASLAFETVFSSKDKLDYVRRVMEGGHDVPITKIIQRFRGSLANASAAAAVVDRFYLFDNSVDRQAPRRLFRAADGRLAREYEPPPHEVAAMLRDAVTTRP
jgi:predicted ABC-type ATPase